MKMIKIPKEQYKELQMTLADRMMAYDESAFNKYTNVKENEDGNGYTLEYTEEGQEMFDDICCHVHDILYCCGIDSE